MIINNIEREDVWDSAKHNYANLLIERHDSEFVRDYLFKKFKETNDYYYMSLLKVDVEKPLEINPLIINDNFICSDNELKEIAKQWCHLINEDPTVSILNAFCMGAKMSISNNGWVKNKKDKYDNSCEYIEGQNKQKLDTQPFIKPDYLKDNI